MKKRLTISVGISAFNEEANIKALLQSILSQKSSKFTLLEIIVVDDCSTDHTAEEIKIMKDPRIRLIHHNKRLGMIKSINQIFRITKGDVLIKIDADVLPTTKKLFERLVEPFKKNTKVGFVSGKLIPTSSKSFIESSINISRWVWDKIKVDLYSGNSVYSCAGGIYALSHSFSKSLVFPKEIWADIGYIYFSCITKGYKFVSVKRATVWFHPPTKITEYVNQIKRYEGESEPLYKFFPEKLIRSEYLIPKSLLFKYEFYAFLKSPFLVITIFLLNFYARHFSQNKRRNYTAKWIMLNSTHKKIEKEHSDV